MNIQNLMGEYSLRPREEQAIKGLLLAPTAGARCLLVTGAPGTGKTFLAECLAAGLGAEFVKYQSHAWTCDEDMFVGVNVTAAVAGDADGVRQPGCLLRAARLSATGQVVLLVDELDKAREETDSLLLDFLQSGQCPNGQGLTQANLDNLLVVITSNATREHSDALLRRCRRVAIESMSTKVMVDILVRKLNITAFLARKAVILAHAASPKTCTTVQEVSNFLTEVGLDSTTSYDVVEMATYGWLVRDPTDVGSQLQTLIREFVVAYNK